MATISYVNDALLIGGLNFNPAFEEVLDANVFVFDAGLGSGVDRITDFRRKEGDDIHLAKSMFPKLKPGKLKKSAFEFGIKADDRKDRILYDKNTGALRYDDDGTGKHKAKIFAILDDAANLKAADIFVI